ncbi:PQQ-binding-like beta-propeller repeat protein [Dactylosporangium vinaceum]|uniref:PQQ-binding-like beta-propeller repeat protein n=1 Tax=Dactylosporangium vinaceum TaxID=53362 RepID=A0ABV5LYN5_9ACTN|nr:PQQ-binding-like beta-propeller repeat protein [Dactylosporangium vinaceum]UAB98254.1 PQQ-binding-like beta-propeller repeat protein [Dactylosporangium vinaceum]
MSGPELATGPVAGLIELGDTTEAWAPPPAPIPARQLLAVVVAVLTAFAAVALAADGPGLAPPVFTLPDRVIDATVGGGRLFVTRYEPDTAGRFEARTIGGRLLWTRPRAQESERLLFAYDGVAVVVAFDGGGSAAPYSVTALDADSGAELWHRDTAIVNGYADGRFVLRDVGAEDGWRGDQPVRLEAVEARTGASAWTATLAPGSMLSWPGDGYAITSIDELTLDGNVQRHDPATGAVTFAQRLAGFDREAATDFSIYGGEAVVGRPGSRSADVYSLASGRLVWQYETALDWGLFACGAMRWCTASGEGIRAFDAATGRAAWGIGEYNDVFGLSGDRLVLGSLGNTASIAHRTVVVTVDARTGAILDRLDDWVGTFGGVGDEFLLSHTDAGQWVGVVGLYNARTGAMRIVGRGRIGPAPQCRRSEGAVVCIGNGLNVWRLP